MIREIKKRTGQIVQFDRSKITNVMRKAFAGESLAIDESSLEQMTDRVVSKIEMTLTPDSIPSVEQIQDYVEETLMERGYFRVAKAYIVYRFEHQKQRAQEVLEQIEEQKLTVEKRDGTKEKFSREKMKNSLAFFVRNYESVVDLDDVVRQVEMEVYDGIKTSELAKLVTLVLRSRIERDPAYSVVAARQLSSRLYKEAIGDERPNDPGFTEAYRSAFVRNVKKGVAEKKLDERMLSVDLEALASVIEPDRDDLFKYLGVETLNDRYFIRGNDKNALETPQYMWMRIAIGLSLNESDITARAKEFYNIMSTLRFVPSTPTLFHAGTPHPQLSSCYLNLVEDDLNHIFKVYGDNAQLSKWAGGIGTAWSKLRATGALIKTAGITSQGTIPFLKIANDVTVAINRSGRRRGATCVYLENWHYDFEDFLELRKNTGDERRRTHDMNTATWVSDLFMKRVKEDGRWTLFSPDETPELTETYGKTFEEHYTRYERLADEGKIHLFKNLRARDLFRRMLGSLYETGHPWITFKDPSNIRSPQDHAGVVHNSNLCTEITLNTSAEETAVCNLGSVNLGEHIEGGVFSETKVRETVTIAMRMLDNVIDLNFYPTIEARNSNMKHRPVGLGIMGFHDALYKLNINFASDACVEFSDYSMEVVSYHAILASTDLARERGAYQSFAGSKWSRNILPQDTIALLEENRGISTGVIVRERLDWNVVRNAIRQYGMRNSNTMAIAPTATISNIAGSVPGIEPIYKNIYVKSNISGDFIVVNQFLVEDLKALGLWNLDMLDRIKYHDGSIQAIAEIPLAVREKYRETFEIDMRWIVKAAAARGKWIDQSQSLNIFFSGTSGKELSDLYLYAWESGLKTTYYLRSLGASQVEKSTIDAKGTQIRQKTETDQKPEVAETQPAAAPVPSPLSAPQPSGVMGMSVPSPIATPSPLTKEAVEAGKVGVVAREPERPAVAAVVAALSGETPAPTLTTAPANKPKYKLHVAEEAICESCQ